MNKIKILISSFILLFLLISISCESDITRLNEDQKNPNHTDYTYLLTNAEIEIANQMSTTSVNYNIMRTFTQQITETEYLDESRYNLFKRRVPDNTWNKLNYGLNSLALAKEGVRKDGKIDEITKKNKILTIEALEAYIYSVLVDTYGDVPYSESTQIDKTNTPKYDDAFTIYKSLIKKCDDIYNGIDISKSGFTNGDLIFKGNLLSVKKFAATLKLRLGINLADVDNVLAKNTVESAYKQGVILLNSDNLGIKFDKSGLFTSPIFQEVVQSGRNDWVAANTLVDVLNQKSDPRREKFFTSVSGDKEKFVAIGGEYGKGNLYSNFSHIHPSILVADYKYNLFEAAENLFILAEAAERGYSVGGTASSYFKKGIQESMESWGVNSEDAKKYIAANDYAGLSGTWKQKIGNEAWIATYNRGLEAWTFSRRLDFRNFVPPAQNPLPTRLYYPIKESSVNRLNRDAAVVKQWGSVSNDVQSSKIFWDKY
ncbi:SusD/RagB family nutrient-binding outer membrane lipoprotein [Elizabethkingia argentiflava]|uniref:SusD/RagB family nutrient-binding outer membrane lipoprotein n=1 Tax=Elizabethkingia argenteiflava TaxID=2681556 RepID=A0A845PYP3_9FLAO|nr:SusD/RagB family nutrient-binding outer membrane lipoprotein [Elizabethkingia argenteiflava]NAW51936.1 SusD/RagB family nutrient-binding outer membrane lipoprotein [Elizabethkingia argenteiflava]